MNAVASTQTTKATRAWLSALGPSYTGRLEINMSRRISVEIVSPIEDAQYANIANAVWMLLRVTPHQFAVYPDEQADLPKMDAAWNMYGEEASWTD